MRRPWRLGTSGVDALQLRGNSGSPKPGLFFTFNGGSLANVVNSGTPTLSASASVADQFIYDIFENPTNCVFFTIVGDYLNDPSESSDHILSGGGTATSNSTAVGTITLLFRPPDPGPPSGVTTGPSGHCVFSAGGTLSSDNAFSLIIQNPNSYSNPPCSLVLAFGDSTNVLLAASNLVWDAWYYFALTYNESDTSTNKATWYLGRLTGAGTLATGTTLNTNVAVAGDGTDFYLGSEPSAVTTLCKPGDGRVDEVATWNKQLTAAQIQAQFAALPNPAGAAGLGLSSGDYQPGAYSLFPTEQQYSGHGNWVVLDRNQLELGGWRRPSHHKLPPISVHRGLFL